MFYVYFIQCKEFVKVGYARNVERRLEALLIGCPFSMKILAKFPMESLEEARLLEADLHRKLHKWHKQGEWFYHTGVKRALRIEVNGHKLNVNRRMEWVADVLRP